MTKPAQEWHGVSSRGFDGIAALYFRVTKRLSCKVGLSQFEESSTAMNSHQVTWEAAPFHPQLSN